MLKPLCVYYQAQVKRPDCWFLVAAIRACEHLAFDRTVNKQDSIFEFFVPEAMDQEFHRLMDYFIKEEIVVGLTRLPNPFAEIS